MTPRTVITIAIICAIIGIPLGRWKNQWWRGMLAGLILGPLGLLIMLVIPVSEETRIRREQEKLRVQAEATRRAGYPPPPQQPYAPQGPYPQQPAPGQWQQPPPPPSGRQPDGGPGSWEQPPPATWPGPQQ